MTIMEDHRKQPRIKWTEDEEDRIAQQAALRYLDPQYIGDPLSATMEAAQKAALPPERVRRCFPSQMAGVLEKLKTHIQSLVDKPAPPPQVRIEYKEIPKIEYITPEPAVIVKSLSTGQLLDELLSRMSGQFASVLGSLTQLASSAPGTSPVGKPIRPENEEPELPKAQGPKVLVLGLPYIKVMALQNRLARKDIRLQHVDTSNPNPRVPPGANYVVISPRGGINHKWTYQAESIYGKDKVFVVPSRAKLAEQKIMELLSNGHIPTFHN